ncbi:MAG: WD40 repeat domain-containing protein [Methylocystis sp.]|nr:WD40 repeat domain-containing protein [Methylocystis sp.]
MILWNGKTGEEIKRFELSIGATTDLKFSPDGSKLAVSGNTNGGQVNVFGDLTLTVFDLPTKKPLQRYELKQQLRKTGCNVTLPFAFTPDGSQIYSLTQECRVGLFDAQTFKQISSFGPHYSDYALSFGLSPDGRILVVALAKRLELWDAASGQLIKKLDIPQLVGNYDNYFHRVAFSPDGRAVVVKSGVMFSYFAVTTVWGVPQTP